MPVNAVKNRVQIAAYRQLTGFFVASQDMHRVVVIILAVRCGALCHALRQRKTADGAVHKAQIDNKAVAAEVQHIQRDLLYLLLLFLVWYGCAS